MLQVESKIIPVGIDVKPRFPWAIHSTQHGFTQTSYRILVSKFLPDGSDVWNSRIVRSSKSHLTEYAGPTLTSNTHYFWTVNAITLAGQRSASSEFTTGLLVSGDRGSRLSIVDAPRSPHGSIPRIIMDIDSRNRHTRSCRHSRTDRPSPTEGRLREPSTGAGGICYRDPPGS